MGQLIGEEVCGDGAAPDWAGKARSAGTIRDLLTTPNPYPTQAMCALVALRLEPRDDDWVVEP